MKSGKLPIMCRISFNRQTCTFSTNLSVEAKLWNDKNKRLKGRSEEAVRTNKLLDQIQYLLYDNYLKLLHSQEEITPYAIRNAYWGLKDDSDNLIAYFEKHNLAFEKMVGTTRRPSTLYKYRYVCAHLQKFLRSEMNVTDIPLRKVNRDLICMFHRYLTFEAGCNVNTTRTYLTALKHILMLAVVQGHITQNPFAGYELRSEPSRRAFLTKQELRRMIDLEPHGEMESLVQDAFLFSCFTGLAYVDIKRLTMDDVVVVGKRWHIATKRHKTRTCVDVPLLQLPVQIIKKYYDSGADTLFPLPTNCWCNKLLKIMAERAHIDKHLTFHTARHTFATTITLSYGVPIEAVSRMLGHTDIKTTQIYAKVLETLVCSEMNRASEKINSYFQRKI